jgi:hypothetical protein
MNRQLVAAVLSILFATTLATTPVHACGAECLTNPGGLPPLVSIFIAAGIWFVARAVGAIRQRRIKRELRENQPA